MTDRMKIRLTTFNIQHGRNYNLPGDQIDLTLMADTARDTGASVFGFNEVRRGVGDSPFDWFSDMPSILGKLLGGEAIFAKALELGEGKDYGNAIVSRFPIIESETVAIPLPSPRTGDGYYEPRAILRALIDVGGKTLTVLSSHFGLNSDERDMAVDTALAILRRTDGPAVLMGDFNMTPDDPNYARLAAHMTDAAASVGEESPTFPSDAPKDRIDYIFVRGMTVAEAHVHGAVASDHRALTAELCFPD